MRKTIIFTALSLFYSGLILAQENPVTDYSYGSLAFDSTQQMDYLQISAEKNSQSGEFTKMPEGIKDKPVFEEDWLTANKIHKYLGIGSITLGILSAIVPKPPKENPDDGIHKDLAEGAACWAVQQWPQV